MESIYRQFVLDGLPISCARYGSGHINETYLLVTSRPHLYILQKINSYVFHNASGLMDNIIAVTDALRRQDPDPRHVLTLVPTQDGRPYLTAGEGEYWRLYEFVTDSLCLDKPESVDDLKQSGVAFGMFQNQLADFPAHTLTETIPHFHDTPARYEQLKQAVQENRAGRVNQVRAELDFYLAREQEAAALMDLCHAGKLPLRVTHNDTKLNNVMLDRFTRAPLCVIDLDTVMPGLAANDFGDSIRFGANHSAEDERDLTKVNFDLELFDVYAAGFLEGAGGALTETELDYLPWGAKLMTLECGIRFLTDYLEGDHYFRIHREGQNLDRCRTQFKLVSDMEAAWDDMKAVVDKYR